MRGERGEGGRGRENGRDEWVGKVGGSRKGEGRDIKRDREIKRNREM